MDAQNGWSILDDGTITSFLFLLVLDKYTWRQVTALGRNTSVYFTLDPQLQSNDDICGTRKEIGTT